MISETRTIYFRHVIDQDGSISAETLFKIKSDAENSDAARADAAEWAGTIGDPLKVGNGGSNSWTEDKNLLISAINICQLDHESVFDVKLSAKPVNDSWMLLPGSERIEKDGTVTETKEFSCCSKTVPSYPHEGDIIVAEDNSRMICISSKVTELGNNCRKLTVVFKNFTEAEITEPPQDSFRKEFRNNEHIIKAVFYWTSEIYGTKIAELKFFDENYRPDWLEEGYVLCLMETTCDDKYGYIVELTAQKVETKLISCEVSNDGSCRKAVAVYHVRNSDSADFSGLIGTAPNFISGNFIINEEKEKIINPAIKEITLRAEECKDKLQIGEIKSEYAENGITCKKATFFVNKSDIENFRSELIPETPASWAGENYYLQSYSEKESAAGSTFELCAREVYTRMLSLEQKEKFSGYTINGTPCREVIYKSLWQVKAGDISAFCNISGANASWSNDDAIITGITPKQKSSIEYTVTIEAQRRSNPELHTFYNCQDYENLSGRVDLNCEMVEFRLSPKDCGYFIDSDGLYDLIPGWLPSTECPFLTASALHPRCINAVIKILRLSETTYHKGSMKKNIEEMTSWIVNRVFNGKIGGINGSFLKVDLNAKEIYDNHGVQWTKITKIYDMAPAGENWSPYHFKHLGA